MIRVPTHINIDDMPIRIDSVDRPLLDQAKIPDSEMADLKSKVKNHSCNEPLQLQMAYSQSQGIEYPIQSSLVI